MNGRQLRLLGFVGGAVGGTLACGSACGQWITFSDETATRLDLATVPIDDDQEKDMAVGDFNHDGWDDVIVVRKKPFSNPGARQDVLLMNEQGVLVDRTSEYASDFTTHLTDARDVAVVDVNNDGWEDLAMANTFGQQPALFLNLGVDNGGNWLGFEDQSWRLEELDPPPGGQLLTFCAIWPNDANGDGWQDLYFGSYSPQGGTTTDRMLVNQGDGTFLDETEETMGERANSAFGTAAEMHDMNQDGHVDVVKNTTLYGVPPWNEQGQFIVWNDGTMDYMEMPYQSLDVSSPYMLTVGDLNGDGILDVYSVQDGQDQVHLSTSMEEWHIWYNNSTIGPSPRTEGFGGNVKMVDIDGDGDLDVGVSPVDVDIANCDFGGGDFALLRNPGDGDVADPWGSSQNIHEPAHDFAFVDIDRDGCLDIVMGLCEGWRVFMRNDCPVADPAELLSFDVLRGALVSGGLSDLVESDDSRLRARSQLGFSAFEANVMELAVEATSPHATAADLDVIVESNGDTPNMTGNIRLRNWDTNALVTLGNHAVTGTDQVVTFENVDNPNAFIRDSDDRMELRVKHVAPATFSAFGFSSRIDQTLLRVTAG